MPARSLVSLARNACIKNKRSLTDVGDFQYSQIRAVLESIDSPTQLHLIETNSPQIQGEDAELWQRFIARDIPKWEQKNYVPRNPKNWHKVYKKYARERDEDLKRDEEVLMASLAGIKKERAANVSQIVDMKLLPKLPRDPKMQYNAGIKIGRKGFKKDNPSSLVWNAGSKTKLTDGKSVLTRARREAKEISQRSKLAKPTHQLGGSLAQIRKAPAGMVDEYRRAAEPPLRILARRRTTVAKLPETDPALEERERRLRALTGSRKYDAPTQATVVSSDEEDDEEDDLLDERPRPSAGRPQSSVAASHVRPRPSASASTSNPTTRSQQQSRPRPSSPPSNTSPKPSDLISAMIQKPRAASPTTSSSAASVPRNTPQRRSSPASGNSSSPASGPSAGEKRPPMMMQRKRAPVDIFNRKVKRPRQT